VLLAVWAVGAGCAEADRSGLPCEPGVVDVCYEGPPGTRDVGLCRAGLRVCAAETGRAVCMGQVLPAPVEVCNSLDDDCNGLTDERGACAQRELDMLVSVVGDLAVVRSPERAGPLFFGGSEETRIFPCRAGEPASVCSERFLETFRAVWGFDTIAGNLVFEEESSIGATSFVAWRQTAPAPALGAAVPYRGRGLVVRVALGSVRSVHSFIGPQLDARTRAAAPVESPGPLAALAGRRLVGEPELQVFVSAGGADELPVMGLQEPAWVWVQHWADEDDVVHVALVRASDGMIVDDRTLSRELVSSVNGRRCTASTTDPVEARYCPILAEYAGFLRALTTGPGRGPRDSYDGRGAPLQLVADRSRCRTDAGTIGRYEETSDRGARVVVCPPERIEPDDLRNVVVHEFNHALVRAWLNELPDGGTPPAGTRRTWPTNTVQAEATEHAMVEAIAEVEQCWAHGAFDGGMGGCDEDWQHAGRRYDRHPPPTTAELPLRDGRCPTAGRDCRLEARLIPGTALHSLPRDRWHVLPRILEQTVRGTRSFTTWGNPTFADFAVGVESVCADFAAAGIAGVRPSDCTRLQRAFFDAEILGIEHGPNLPEDCDGVDNDGDGRIDEEEGRGDFTLTQPGCYTADGGLDDAGSPVGPCRRGFRRCEGRADGGTGTGLWARWSETCEGQVVPHDERCEELGTSAEGDWNCNGTVGEGCDCRPSDPPHFCGSGPFFAACDTHDLELAPDGGRSCNVLSESTCQRGNLQCVRGQFTGVCLGARGPGTDVCDGLDNDCDGRVDAQPDGGPLSEAFYTGTARTRGVGECRDGTRTCQGGVWRLVADVTPTAETCNGLDDDCDGYTDNAAGSLSDWTLTLGACWPPGQPGRHMGECRDGELVCSAGGEPRCENAIVPKDEECNGLDDDCNGYTDDERDSNTSFTLSWGRCYSGPARTRGVGACRQGWHACDAPPQVCIGEVVPAATETCNGLDDDCDGLTDEAPGSAASFTLSWVPCYAGYSPATMSRGACRPGMQPCQGASSTCIGAVTPTTEVCNGVDDDCDGHVDNAPGSTVDDSLHCAVSWQSCYSGPAGTQDRGACHGGWRSCQQGTCSGPCLGEVLPATELCNGVDDDCDGLIDEAPGSNSNFTLSSQPCYSGPSGTRNVGVCRGGQQYCHGSTLGACADETVPGSETCNGLDDDCDGHVDEDPVCVESLLAPQLDVGGLALIRGDGQFGGNPVLITLDVSLLPQGSNLLMSVALDMLETAGDFSEGWKSVPVVLPASRDIDSLVSSSPEHIQVQHTDGTGNVQHFAFGNDRLVQSMDCLGDTPFVEIGRNPLLPIGHPLGGSYCRISFNAILIRTRP